MENFKKFMSRVLEGWQIEADDLLCRPNVRPQAALVLGSGSNTPHDDGWIQSNIL